jgi:hypothetical protein
MGAAARSAVPALLKALATGPGDHDTGDGVIPVRSSVIEALGRIGDPRAVDPVAHELASPAYTYVALEALTALGPVAVSRADDVKRVLRARIADEAGRRAAGQQAVRQLEIRLACDAVAARKRREHPEASSVTVSLAEQAAAVAALDRSSERYRRAREDRCRDPVGEAAVRALAALRCEGCTAAIVDALGTPEIAREAVWALGRTHPLPPRAVSALRAVVASRRHGPLVKEAAEEVLGRGGSLARTAGGLASAQSAATKVFAPRR